MTRRGRSPRRLAQDVLDARAAWPGSTLADLYDPLSLCLANLPQGPSDDLDPRRRPALPLASPSPPSASGWNTFALIQKTDGQSAHQLRAEDEAQEGLMEQEEVVAPALAACRGCRPSPA